MEYREEVVPMMLGDGALLMKGGGRKAGGKRTRGQEAVVSRRAKKDPDNVIRKADGRRRRMDLVVIESCRELPRVV
jgi:hypothetical protein